MDDAPRVAVIGAGAWGTTLAAIVARREPALIVTHSLRADRVELNGVLEDMVAPGGKTPDQRPADESLAAHRAATAASSALWTAEKS